VLPDVHLVVHPLDDPLTAEKQYQPQVLQIVAAQMESSFTLLNFEKTI
jgi:hypothetical protein